MLLPLPTPPLIVRVIYIFVPLAYMAFRINQMCILSREHEADNIVFPLSIRESRVKKVRNLPKVKRLLTWRLRVGDLFSFYLPPKRVFNHCSMDTRHST